MRARRPRRPKAVPLASLTGPQQRLIQALLDAAKAASEIEARHDGR
jgi:hypothetical protein